MNKKTDTKDSEELAMWEIIVILYNKLEIIVELLREGYNSKTLWLWCGFGLPYTHKYIDTFTHGV